MWQLYQPTNHTHTHTHIHPHTCSFAVVLHTEVATFSVPPPLLLHRRFKVLSVGVGGDGDVDDEGGLVLDAFVSPLRQGADLHPVGVGLSEGPGREQYPLQVLVSQGEV